MERTSCPTLRLIFSSGCRECNHPQKKSGTLSILTPDEPKPAIQAQTRPFEGPLILEPIQKEVYPGKQPLRMVKFRLNSKPPKKSIQDQLPQKNGTLLSVEEILLATWDA